MTIGERIKYLREEREYSQVDLANIVGISKQSLYKYENNIITNIPSDKIELVANALNTTPSYLMGWDEESAHSHLKGVKIPVLGNVSAGIPVEAIEDIIDYEEITEEMNKTGEFFALRINGDSMEPKFSIGDVVIVKKQEDAESGDVVIVTINGNDATCKRLKKYNDNLVLISSNPKYEPMIYTSDDVKNKPISILGKVVELRAKF